MAKRKVTQSTLVKNSFIENYIIQNVIPAKKMARVRNTFMAVATDEDYLKQTAEYLGENYCTSLQQFDKKYTVHHEGMTDRQKHIANKERMLLCSKKVDMKDFADTKQEMVLCISNFASVGVEEFDVDEFLYISDDIVDIYLVEDHNIKEKYTENEGNDFLNSILDLAISKGASDVSFTGKEDGYSIDFQIDGTMHNIDHRSIEFMSICIKILRVRCNLNADTIVNTLDGKMLYEYRGKTTSWRFAMLKLDLDLYRITMRVPTFGASAPKLDNLGYYPRVRDMIRKAARSEKGLQLFSGPTGSGKTTVLYAVLLENVERFGDTIITLENPIETSFRELHQVSINEHFTYQDAIKSALRANPDRLLIGEVRDRETARAAVDAALTGHGAYSTLHVGQYSALVSRLTNLGVSEDDMISTLAAVFIQRKVIKLCTKCKTLNETTGYYEAVVVENNPLEACFMCKGVGYSSIVPINQAYTFKDNLLKFDADAIDDAVEFLECLDWHLIEGNIDFKSYEEAANKLSLEIEGRTPIKVYDGV
ncbi:MAG: hypothetical protein DRG78_02380 [Epsilonproteobacteria bacterium]|nr:MAG: hypothetical protein DRG78_02380 [Campylobacterota bacterium]